MRPVVLSGSVTMQMIGKGARERERERERVGEREGEFFRFDSWVARLGLSVFTVCQILCELLPFSAWRLCRSYVLFICPLQGVRERMVNLFLFSLCRVGLVCETCAEVLGIKDGA
jgi:hypothetical protein